MGFQHGDPKPPGSGRQKGTPNKATAELREIIRNALAPVFDEAYFKAVKQRILTGDEHPAIVVQLLKYRFGDPSNVPPPAAVPLIFATRYAIGEHDPLAHATPVGAGSTAETIAPPPPPAIPVRATVAEEAPPGPPEIPLEAMVLPADAEEMTPLEEFPPPRGGYQ